MLVWSAVVAVGILVPFSLSAQQFVLDTLATHPAVAGPSSVVFVPDGQGSFYFSEKNTGLIRLFSAGKVRTAPFATVNIANAGDQGLLAVTLHPQYPDSPYVYALYTRASDRANVVVRFRDSSGVGVAKRMIVACPRINAAKIHVGGSINFGPDGKLYVGFGDNFTSANAQDSSAENLRGKILRLNPDGSIPTDNPYPATPFWSMGHRNPQGIAWDPVTKKLYATDSGPSCGDEVNLVNAGANLGWPADGNCSYSESAEYAKPLHYFPAQQPGLSGITIYRHRAFPALDGTILVASKNSGTVWSMKLMADGDSVVSGSIKKLLTYPGGFSAVETGPDGNIYLLAGYGTASRIFRLRPVAPVFVSAPLMEAKQGEYYSYRPEFKGTTPSLSLVNAPDGMTIEATGTIRWLPTNAQALEKQHPVTLRAANGAGSAEQSFSVTVENVNDPPNPFTLSSPPPDTAMVFTAATPGLYFVWNQSFDPDLDTVRYIVQIDTSESFATPALRNVSAGEQLSVQVSLPRQSQRYYWRIKATDGAAATLSPVRSLNISYITSLADSKIRKKDADTVASLQQNFPNPFNPSTVIQYTLPKAGYVRLAVFNLLGQEVALIFEGTQSAGTYEVEFNKEGLPTGIYFYRIQAPGFAETRKMIITK